MKRVNIFDHIQPGDIVEFYQCDGPLLTRELILSHPNEIEKYKAFMLFDCLEGEGKIKHFYSFYYGSEFKKIA